MANQNLIINRLQQRGRQINRMLTPGLKKTESDQPKGSMASIFTLFGGGKFKLAAKKMRFLDDKKLGRQHPDTLEQFSKSIPERFKGVQKLLHFSPSTGKDAGFWSKIDRPLPNQGPTQFDAPAQPGELRPGSIIQSLPMFPKPGQSIESFKEQARSLPKPKPRATRRKPSLDPKSRMFSRVQEIHQESDQVDSTPQESPSGESKKTTTDNTKAPNSRTVQRQVDGPSEQSIQAIEIGDTDVDAEILDLPSSKAETQLDEIVTDDPTAFTEDQSKAAAPVLKEKPEEEETKYVTSLEAEVAKPIKHEVTRPSYRELPKARPITKKRPDQVQPRKAKPSKIQTPQVQRKPDTPPPPKAKPITGRKPQNQVLRGLDDRGFERPEPQRKALPKRDSESADRQQAEPLETTPEIPVDTPEETQQETIEDKVPQALETEISKESPATTPFKDETQQDTSPQKLIDKPLETTFSEIKERTSSAPKTEVISEASSALPGEQPKAALQDRSPIEPKGPAPEMPLHRKINSRRQIAKTLKSLEPETVKPRTAAPFIIQRASPLIPSQKYRQESKGDSIPREPLESPFSGLSATPQSTREGTSSHFFPGSEAVLGGDTLPFPSDIEGTLQQTEPLNLSLVYPPISGEIQTQPDQQQPTRMEYSPLQASLAQTPTPTPPTTQPLAELDQTGPVIPLPSSDSPTATSQVKTIQRVGEETYDDEDEAPEIDLDQLAEDVLPLVKRILEIESERLSRYQR